MVLTYAFYLYIKRSEVINIRYLYLHSIASSGRKLYCHESWKKTGEAPRLDLTDRSEMRSEVSTMTCRGGLCSDDTWDGFECGLPVDKHQKISKGLPSRKTNRFCSQIWFGWNSRLLLHCLGDVPRGGRGPLPPGSSEKWLAASMLQVNDLRCLITRGLFISSLVSCDLTIWQPFFHVFCSMGKTNH